MSQNLIHIPKEEIRHPNGYHSDPLGFTFFWKGHFLRGIHPQSVEYAKRYFDCGFIEEVCSKGLFPKTWISQYESEEFGMIIEHEVVTPNIYSTDWSFSMLKDAALLVLEMAKIGKKYGYNMIDCHKLNIMFQNSKPIYVDLGSFILTEKGTSAWRPYLSFLRSYYFILSMWNAGAGQFAKRLMTPGVECNEKDYYVFKRPVWRCFPNILNRYLTAKTTLHSFAATDNENIANKVAHSNILIRKSVIIGKNIVNILKPLSSQRQWSMNLLGWKIKRMSISKIQIASSPSDSLKNIATYLDEFLADCQKATVFGVKQAADLKLIFDNSQIRHIIAINESEIDSENVYKGVQRLNLPVTCTYFKLAEGNLLLRNRFPEQRLSSDISIVLSYTIGDGNRGLYSADWFIKERLLYSNSHIMLLHTTTLRPDLINHLSAIYDIKVKEVEKGGAMIFIEER